MNFNKFFIKFNNFHKSFERFFVKKDLLSKEQEVHKLNKFATCMA